jgi:predicted ATPase/transcriptional regulator with XRE-family HTH domain/Tfp pilus assembly protein PilF
MEATALPIYFGEWLKRRRKALDLTQAELAEHAGCSVFALRKIESGDRRPSKQLAGLLAQSLQIPPQEQATFVRVARGELNLERLPAPGQAHVPVRVPAPTPIPLPPTHNLPVLPTPLVGREAELASLNRLLGDPNCRLLTLVGPGGIGKSRLALEAASRQGERFAGGVYYVSLTGANSPEFMVPSIAQAVGLNFAGPAEPRSQLFNYLGNKQALVLLDNLEHLLEGVEVLSELLAGAPGLKLLATSRARLELSGEWVFEVEGLPVPPEGQLEGVESYSAVELFLQRARQARVDFELSGEDHTDVVRICRLVEGMPLAIELAAAWVRMLTCAEITGEIERGLDILATRLRDVPERQRSINAVFDHSWHLLSEEEQQVLRRISVFRSGFTRQAAEAVAGAGLELLLALVAKSFLRSTSEGRYGLHELVRQYVNDRLAEAPDDEVAARDRHSAYFTELVAQLEDKLKGAEQLQALAVMDAEIDNIRAGWRWAVRRGQTGAVHKPIRALAYFYSIRGWFQEGEATFGWAADQLEGSLIVPGKSEPTVDRLSAYARALQGWFSSTRGQLDQSQALLQSGLASLRLFGLSKELADVLYYLGAVTWLTGDFQRARAYFLEELAVAEQAGNQWDIAMATSGLAEVAQTVGEYAEAEERWQTALAISRRSGDQRLVAIVLHFYGILNHILGAHLEAQAYLRESLELSSAAGDRLFYGMALSHLGEVTCALGDDAEAVRLLNESVTLLRELGEHWSLLHALIGLGAATLALGDYAASHAAYTEALTMAWERQSLPEVLEAMIGMARWSMRQGDGDEMQPEALASIQFVLNHPAATQKTKDDACQLRSELEGRLAPDQLEAAQVNAKNLSLETLVTGILKPAGV